MLSWLPVIIIIVSYVSTLQSFTNLICLCSISIFFWTHQVEFASGVYTKFSPGIYDEFICNNYPLALRSENFRARFLYSDSRINQSKYWILCFEHDFCALSTEQSFMTSTPGIHFTGIVRCWSYWRGRYDSRGCSD